MTEFNPASIEAAMKACYERISKGVSVCDERYRAYLKANHDYDIAVAHAMVDLDGAAYLKKFKAELATVAERKVRDDAKATWRYAESRAEALSTTGKALAMTGRAPSSATTAKAPVAARLALVRAMTGPAWTTPAPSAAAAPALTATKEW